MTLKNPKNQKPKTVYMSGFLLDVESIGAKSSVFFLFFIMIIIVNRAPAIARHSSTDNPFDFHNPKR